MDTLVLNFSVRAGGRVELAPELRPNTGPTQEWPVHPEVCSDSELKSLSERLVRQLTQAASALGEDRPAEMETAKSILESQIKPLGEELRRAILPDQIVRALRAKPSISHLLFKHDPQLNPVPFDCVLLDDEFAAFRFATARRLLSSNLRAESGPRRPGKLPYKACGIIDPGASLSPEIGMAFNRFRRDWIIRRQDTLVDFSESAVTERVEKRGLLDCFRRCEFLNLLCHYFYDKENPGQSGFILESLPQGGRLLFRAQDLVEGLGEGDLRPLLLFSMACSSGTTAGWEAEWPRTSKLFGLVDAVLQVGIPHHIGAIVDLPAALSGQIFEPFYTQLTNGCTVGEALRRARRALRVDPHDSTDAGTVLGLGLVLFGNPAAGYLSAAGLRTAESQTVQCEAEERGELCLRLIAQTEDGFAAKRCGHHWTPVGLRCSGGHQIQKQALLSACSAETSDGKRCKNTVCPDCPGHGQQLCWEHCCHPHRHPVPPGAGKTCPNPRGLHSDEKRTVCPRDRGWIRGWCDDCLNRT